MSRTKLGVDVFQAALDRLAALYTAGDRVLVSFSGGKDSGVCLELAIMAAQQAGRTDPVEVIMRDDEIMTPGTFEYAERVAARPEITFYWVVARQPVINIFNRDLPYFWAFDPDLDPEQWVRRFPDFAIEIEDKNIRHMVNYDRFPPAEGKRLISVVGMRGEESHFRLMATHSSGGYLTKPTENGVRMARPIYDWTTGDVWKAHLDMGWDYNEGYDVMRRLGVPARLNRIGPPSQSLGGVRWLGLNAQAWPAWWRRVTARLPGIRSAAQYGLRAIIPQRRTGESYEDLYHRAILSNSPDWIIARGQKVKERMLSRHAGHADYPFPDEVPCYLCSVPTGSWKKLVKVMATGDPFSFQQNMVPALDPEFFRPGAGSWHPSKSGHKVVPD